MACVAIKIGRSRGRGTAGLFSLQSFWLAFRLGGFFRVAHSSRINADILVVNASPAQAVLKNGQLIRPWPNEGHVTSGTGHW